MSPSPAAVDVDGDCIRSKLLEARNRSLRAVYIRIRLARALAANERAFRTRLHGDPGPGDLRPIRVDVAEALADFRRAVA